MKFISVFLYALFALAADASRPKAASLNAFLFDKLPPLGGNIIFNSTDYDHVSLKDVLVEPLETISPNWLLYTGKNETPEQLKFNCSKSIVESSFNATHKTIFLIFGWRNTPTEWAEKMAPKLVKYYNNEANVIIVDWRKAAAGSYVQAVANTRVVASFLSHQIAALVNATNSSSDVLSEKYHLIGHSLGAHIAGYTGKHFNGSIAHITGLDPAGPFFELTPPAMRLWHSDAMFVDVVHTSALSQGSIIQSGDVDIYVNMGDFQPGCSFGESTDLLENIFQPFSCSHNRAHELYAESLVNKTAKAYKCNSLFRFNLGFCSPAEKPVVPTPFGPLEHASDKSIYFGPRVIESAAGLHQPGNIYFIKTNDKSPFLILN